MNFLGKVMFLTVLAFFSIFSMADDTSNAIVSHRPGEVYSCKVGQNILIELPANDIYAPNTNNNQNWVVEQLQNIIWVTPKIANDTLNLSIVNAAKKKVSITISSVETLETTVKKIIVSELLEDLVIEEKKPESQLAAAKPEESSKKDSEKREKVKFESQFGINGGLFKSAKESQFNVNGSAIVASRGKGGLFFQGALMIDWNGFMKRIGQSIGAGIDQDKFGFFVFLDALELKLGDYDFTYHYQVRPAFRIKTSRLHLSSFYAIPISANGYTGVDDTEDPELGVYNTAVPHFGFDARALLTKKLLFNLNALIGGASLFKIGGGLEYHIAKNFRVAANYSITSFGQYPLMLDEGYKTATEFSLGMRFTLGKDYKFNDMRTQIIYPVDYPIIQTKSLPKEDTGKKSGLYITLDGYPSTGYAPLPVNFSMRFGGGTEPYTVEFKPVYNYQPLTTDNIMNLASLQKAWIYTEPGNYTAKAWITDANGKKAESNEVTITVLKAQGQVWNIVVTAGNGGRVTPGSTQVANGADSPLFRIVADSGFNVDYVLIDGQNKGALSEYQFKAVDRNHTLDAFFSNSVPGKYTINSSAGTGLSIDPSGSRQYNAGSNVDYTVTVVDPDYAIDQVLVDGAPVATGTTSPYVYHFTNIQANHSINATSKRARYTITATAGSGGSINPSGAVKVNSGASQSFTITAEYGKVIESVSVDGSPIIPVPTEYTFTNVQSDHFITATFKTATYTIDVDHGWGGQTIPGTGLYTVNHGDNFVIENKPDAGKKIDYILVDGNGVPVVDKYTFQNVTANHRYRVYFTSSTITLSWRSNNNNRRYIINGVDMGASGSMQVTPNSYFYITWTTISGRAIEAENVEFAQVGQQIEPKGTIWSLGFNIIADTTVSDTSRTLYFYDAYIRSGAGSVYPLEIGSKYPEGFSFTVIVAADLNYVIESIYVNGQWIAGGIENYSFDLVMNSDKIVEVYFRYK